MNQEEFLQRLAAALAPLSDGERARVIDYYREMICDGVESGEDEQELIAGFGAVREITAQILAESRSASSDGIPTVPSVSSPSADPDAYAAEGPVRCIVIDARHTGIEIRPVQGGPVQVHFIPMEQDRVSVSERDGVFTFRHTVEFSLFHWRNLFYLPHKIIVDVPVSFNGELSVSTCNARIEAADLPRLSTVRLVTSNAHLTVSRLTCDSISLRTSNGSLELWGLQGRRCTAETSNGRITADGCRFPDELCLYTSNAAIRVQDALSDNIDFSTGNGPVTAIIRGDMREYAIRSHTSNGPNNLPPELIYPDQQKRLNVSTNNARIDVRFLAET